jgi:CHASE1-domain containing sensor protein
MLSFRDWAPLIVAGVAAMSGVFLVWLAVREAHSGQRKARKAARDRMGYATDLDAKPSPPSPRTPMS